MSDELIVINDERVIGCLVRKAGGQLSFEYAADWQAFEGAYPISLSMPLAIRAHSHKIIEAFLWNLLPDNEVTLGAWGKRFQVSPRSAYSLLSHVGEDCSGAIRFALPKHHEALLNDCKGRVDWLTEGEVAARLRNLKKDAASGRQLSDLGQFSLAGAQPKTALQYHKGRWGVPSGAQPTTHILKPSVLDLDGYEANEHYCLCLAAALGLPVARSSVQHFEDQVVIVVERYDRYRDGATIRRIHQEDLCQALGVPPEKKYENEGGPGAKDLGALIRSASSDPQDDLDTFLKALLFNWFIVGTDAHAKNYSLLLGAAGEVRLAPLYDLSSALPYPSIPIQKAKMAMKVGGKYRVRDINRRYWDKEAQLIGVDSDVFVMSLNAMSEALPDAASAVLAQCISEGLGDPVLPRLAQGLQARAKQLGS